MTKPDDIENKIRALLGTDATKVEDIESAIRARMARHATHDEAVRDLIEFSEQTLQLLERRGGTLDRETADAIRAQIEIVRADLKLVETSPPDLRALIERARKLLPRR